MWMTQYINEVRRQLRDNYKFVPSGGTEQEPLFDMIPDGEYPMEINGKMDYVQVKEGRFKVCQFEPSQPQPEQSK